MPACHMWRMVKFTVTRVGDRFEVRKVSPERDIYIHDFATEAEALKFARNRQRIADAEAGAAASVPDAQG